MENFEVTINLPVINNALTEVLIALLSEQGFDGFIEEEKQLRAFISKSKMDETLIRQTMLSLPLETTINFTIETLENKNWNEEWEKNFFKPIRVGDKCLIRSSFHPEEVGAEYEILIDPKMSFGTGHHATTHLMIEELLSTDLRDKQVLDMGCGTGILAILAAKRGSKSVTAIDVDEWAFNNTLENIAINGVPDIKTWHGGAECLPGMAFDIIIANINRNILLEDMHHYAQVLRQDGTILFSGFYLADLQKIREEAEQCGLTYSHHKTRLDWTMAVFNKINP